MFSTCFRVNRESSSQKQSLAVAPFSNVHVKGEFYLEGGPLKIILLRRECANNSLFTVKV